VATPDESQTSAPTLNTAIGNALGLVWKDYAGRRFPVETDVSGTRIACVLENAVQSFNDGLAGTNDDPADPPPSVRTVAGYRRAAIEAVAKVTHQRVSAFVSKHNAKTDVATEVFILAAPPRGRSVPFAERSQD
jgi:hypothetical protein